MIPNKTSISDVVYQYNLKEGEYDVLLDENDNEYFYFEFWDNGIHVAGTYLPVTEKDMNNEDAILNEFEDMHTVNGNNIYSFCFKIL